jgi:hypothetical protein
LVKLLQLTFGLSSFVQIGIGAIMKTSLTVAGLAALLLSSQACAQDVNFPATGEVQPLTRADCHKAGLRWDDAVNVCEWQRAALWSEGKELMWQDFSDAVMGISLGQPLTKADCATAGLVWDENGNVCDWLGEQLASERTGTASFGQPLTRADCHEAGLPWDDNANVCDWQLAETEQETGSDLELDITGSTTSAQPLTRLGCDEAGLTWNENSNVCVWEAATQQLASEPSPEMIETTISSQPPTRADCEDAGFAWDDTVNVCGWVHRRT